MRNKGEAGAAKPQQSAFSSALEQRKLLSGRELPLLAALLVVAALLFFFSSLAPKGAVAVAEQEGSVLLSRALSSVREPETLRLEGKNGVTVSVTLYPDGAAFTEANCPDLVCVKTGKLTRAGESAVCLPARISLRLTGDSGADAATG